MDLLFGSLGQYVVMLTLAPLSGVIQYIFLGQLRVGAISRYVASLMYALNIFVVNEFLGGGFSILLAYALIPTFAFFALRLFRKLNITNFLLFCISSGALYFSHPHALVMVAPVVVIFWITEIHSRRNRRYIATSATFLFLWAAATLLFYLPYYGNLNVFSDLFSTAFSPTNSRGVLLNVSPQDFAWTYRNAWGLYPNFLSLFNLLGFHYVLLPLAFLSISLTSGHRRKYAIGFGLLISTIVLFIWSTALQLTYPLFLRFTILFIFENPVKLVAMIMFSASILVAFSLDEIFRRSAALPKFRRPSFGHANLVPSIIALTLIAIFLLPLYGTLATGDMGLSAGYPGQSFATPGYFYEINSWLDSRHNSEGFFRTMWLPQGPETLIPSMSIDPWSFALPGASIRFRHESVGFVYTVLSHLVSGDTDNIGELLGMGGVKYVVIDLAHSQQAGDPRVIQYADSYVAVGDPADFVNLLSRQDGLSIITMNNHFAIFENKLYIPHISVYQNNSVGQNYTDIIQWENVTNNLVVNPSFEKGLAQWNTYTSAEISLDSTSARAGNYDARITNMRAPVDGWSVLWQSVPVVGNATYRVSLWLKTEDVNATHAKLVYYSNWNATTEDQAILEQNISGDILGTNNWFQISSNTRAPSAAVRMDFEVLGGWPQAGKTTGTTQVDDVMISRGHFHTNIAPQSTIELKTRKLSETQYQIDLPPHGPLFLILFESYDLNWFAIASDTRVASFKAFGWANGFSLPSAASESVTLTFKGESTRTAAIQVWISVWIFLVIGVIFTGMFRRKGIRLTRAAPR